MPLSDLLDILQQYRGASPANPPATVEHFHPQAVAPVMDAAPPYTSRHWRAAAWVARVAMKDGMRRKRTLSPR